MLFIKLLILVEYDCNGLNKSVGVVEQFWKCDKIILGQLSPVLLAQSHIHIPVQYIWYNYTHA